MLTDSRFENFARGAQGEALSNLPFAESKSRRGNTAAYYRPHFAENNFVRVDLYTPEQNAPQVKTRNASKSNPLE